MEFIPEVILLKIFQYLDFDDLRHAAIVNCQWNRIAYDASLWVVTNLCGLDLGEEDFSFFIDRVSSCVACLDLRSCSGLSSDVLKRILNKCYRLRTLR